MTDFQLILARINTHTEELKKKPLNGRISYPSLGVKISKHSIFKRGKGHKIKLDILCKNKNIMRNLSFFFFLCKTKINHYKITTLKTKNKKTHHQLIIDQRRYFCFYDRKLLHAYFHYLILDCNLLQAISKWKINANIIIF